MCRAPPKETNSISKKEYRKENNYMNKVKKLIAVALCMCVLLPSGSILSFAAENTNTDGELTSQEEPKAEPELTQESKEESPRERKKDEKEKCGSASVRFEAFGEGFFLVKLQGEPDTAYHEVRAGIPFVVNAEIGTTYELTTYKKDFMNLDVKTIGAEILSEENLGKNQSRLIAKVTDSNASISARFSGTFSEPKMRSAALRAASSMSVTISQTGKVYSYDANGNNNFPNIHGIFRASGAYNSTVYCAEHDRTEFVGTTTGTVVSDRMLRKLTYYGWRGPKQWAGFSSSTYNSVYQLFNGNDASSKTEACGVAVTASAITMRYAQMGGKGTNVNVSGRDAFWSYCSSMPDPGASWTCYMAKTGSGTQDMIWGTYIPSGTLKLKKSVANNNEIVAECPNMYSLAGAEYTVYSGTTVKGVLRTNVNGETNSLVLPVGTYTVKETKAPMGFALDRTTYTVTLSLGNTEVLEVEDTPLFDPVTIFLEKIAEDGKGSYVNKNANMSGAEFTVNYYDSFSEDITNISPKRTWKVTTKKHPTGNYVAMLREEYKLPDSDEFFKNETGREVIPRGQITIQETKAPHGYKVDPKVYKYKIEKDSADQLVKLNFGNTPEQPNEPLVPYLKTKASDTATNDNVGSSADVVTIKDEVSYYELSEGEEYTIKGILMDKETGKPLLDKNGKQYVKEQTFTANTDNSKIDGKGARGSIEFSYTIKDAKRLEGKSIVCYANLYWHGEKIAIHEEIENEEQTIHFPKFRTTASSTETDSNLGMPREEETIEDVVKFNNLIVGKEYTVRGRLMDKKTNKPLLDKDGNEYTQEQTFVADSEEMEITLSFTVDSLKRQGETTVVFEELYHEDVLVGIHADIKDEGQSIHYPDIHTTASIDNGSLGKDGLIKIVDEVKYMNLSPDREYTLKGILMDKETRKPLLVDGKEVNCTVKFAPTKKDGKVVAAFYVPANSLVRSENGSSTVIFEKVFDGDVEIAHHEEINDEGQTIGVGIMTIAYDENGSPLTGNSSAKLLFYVLILTAAGLTIASMKKSRKEDE